MQRGVRSVGAVAPQLAGAATARHPDTASIVDRIRSHTAVAVHMEREVDRQERSVGRMDLPGLDAEDCSCTSARCDRKEMSLHDGIGTTYSITTQTDSSRYS